MKDRFKTTRGTEFKRTRRVLVQVIKLATNNDLSHISDRFFNQFDAWVKAEGKRSAVLRLKAIYHTVLNLSLGQIPPNYPFLATTQGFPRAVLYLRPYTGTPEGIQAVLTLLGYWRGIRAPGNPDLTTITSGARSEYPEDLENLLEQTIPENWTFELEELPQVNHIYKTTFGPNGKAVYTSLSDLKALQTEPNLLDSIRNILDETDSEEFRENLDELIENVNWEELPTRVTSSRLSVKRELGGKDRMFAIVDYFSQCTLKPLHKKIAKILSTIRQDATFNQGEAATQIREWTRGTTPTFSYDLSAATDRFPARFQKKVVEILTGSSSFAESWFDLMTNRKFAFRGLTDLRYSVGQPMGAYSSWPVFALSHHLIVMISAKQAGVRNPEYKILGDDIVLRSETLAQCYLRNMERLGVQISLTKTVTGKVAEFAKRLFVEGREISPVPVKLVQSTLRDYRLIGVLANRLVECCVAVDGDFNTVQSGLVQLLPSFYKAGTADKARILLQLPLQGKARTVALQNLVGNLGGSDIESFNKDLDTLLLAIRYKYLIQRYSVNMRRKEHIAKLPGLDTGYQDLHPMLISQVALSRATKRAHGELGKFWTKLCQLGPSVAMPTVNVPTMEELTPSYKKRLKLEATIQLQTYYSFERYVRLKIADPNLRILDYIKNMQIRESTR